MINRRLILPCFVLFLVCTSVLSQEIQETSKEKVLAGFSGGMMLHTGYLNGNIPSIRYQAKGVPFGIGGAIRLHLGKHWMVGSEGYVSTLHQMHNGSYIRYGWGGILGAFYWNLKHTSPYFGLTLGGGGRNIFLMFSGNSHDWKSEETVIFQKQTFFAATPFIGCDFIITKFLHLTLKADYLFPFAKGKLLTPTGPRIYFGALFYH